MNKQVICDINGQFYGLDSLYVRSIETGNAEMLLADTPKFCEGIVKFRGEWVPLIDLREVFGITGEKPAFSQLIYLKNSFGTIGYRVDGVVEIDNIDDKDVQNIPIILNSGKTAYIAGACSHNGRIVVIINQEKLISEDDLKAIKDSLKAVYDAEEAERRRKEEEEARRKAAEEEAKRKADEEAQAKNADKEAPSKEAAPKEAAKPSAETEKAEKDENISAEPKIQAKEKKPEKKGTKTKKKA